MYLRSTRGDGKLFATTPHRMLSIGRLMNITAEKRNNIYLITKAESVPAFPDVCGVSCCIIALRHRYLRPSLLCCCNHHPRNSLRKPVNYMTEQPGLVNSSPYVRSRLAFSLSFCRFFVSSGKYFSKKSIASKLMFLPSACMTVSALQAGHLVMFSSCMWITHRMQKSAWQQPKLTGRHAISVHTGHVQS